MDTFFGTSLMVAGLLIVSAVPLLIVAWWKDRIPVVNGFGIAAGVIAVFFGVAAVGLEVSVENCESDGGIGCADAYFGLVGLMFIVVVGYGLVALVTAIVIGFQNQTAIRSGDVTEWLWCSECTDLVETATHPKDHPLRALGTGSTPL